MEKLKTRDETRSLMPKIHSAIHVPKSNYCICYYFIACLLFLAACVAIVLVKSQMLIQTNYADQTALLRTGKSVLWC